MPYLVFSCSLVFSCWFSLIRILFVRKMKATTCTARRTINLESGRLPDGPELLHPDCTFKGCFSFSQLFQLPKCECLSVQSFISYENLQLRSDLIEVHLCQQKEPWLDDTWSVNLRSVLSDKSGSPPTEQQVKLSGFETTTKEVVSNLFLLISASSSSDPAQMLWNRVKAQNLPRPEKRQSPRKLLSGDGIQKEISVNV